MASGTPGYADAIFADDFESGTLAAWADGADANRHEIISDPTRARSGSRFLAVTYPAGRDGGWLTRFLIPGHDSLYVSYHVRFPAGWRGETKLIGLYGSRLDDQWSAFGKAGRCPSGADFFSTMLVTMPGGEPGAPRFYTYHPGMAREPDGTTCWGRHGDGSESYLSARSISHDTWHHIEFFVALNAPGRSDARQIVWIDGVQHGTWQGFSFRNTDALRLNAIQLTFSVTDGAPQTQRLLVDDVMVRSSRPTM